MKIEPSFVRSLIRRRADSRHAHTRSHRHTAKCVIECSLTRLGSAMAVSRVFMRGWYQSSGGSPLTLQYSVIQLARTSVRPKLSRGLASSYCRRSHGPATLQLSNSLRLRRQTSLLAPASAPNRVRGQMTSRACHVQLTTAAALGADYFGPFGSRAEAISAMRKHCDPQLNDLDKCWSTNPDTCSQ
jgi:hypothetical protein